MKQNPSAFFSGENFMTPHVIEYGWIDIANHNVAYELAYGAGILKDKIYGVSVASYNPETKKYASNFELSAGGFTSQQEALDYIKRLQSDYLANDFEARLLHGCSNTKIRTVNRITTVCLYNTPIISFDRGAKTVTVNHGGYMTKTTKERMNYVLGLLRIDLQIYQKAKQWYFKSSDNSEWIMYRDQMSFLLDEANKPDCPL